MTRKLQAALQTQKRQTEQVNLQIPGLLGLPLDGQKRVEVPGRQAFVFVRLRNNQSEVIQAYNNQVASAYNLPVLVERAGGRYEVVGVDTASYENNWNSNAPFLPRHGNTHSFDLETGGGGDVVWVYPRQFMPALVLPSGSVGAENLVVSPYTLQNSDGTWKYVGNTGTANISQHRPSSSTGAIMGLVYLDAPSGNPYLLINSGTVFLNSITGSSQVYPYIPTISSPSTQIPLVAVRMITGTSALSWDNIYDVRQFLHTITTGSGGGAGTPGGTNNQLQYNNNGAFGGAGIIYTGTSTDEILRTAGAAAAGRNFHLIAEDATGVGDASGGSFSLNGGNTVGSGTAGSIILRGGNSQYGQGGYIGIFAGNSNGQDAAGIIEIIAGTTNNTNPAAQGFVSINDPYTDNQHRFITSGTSTTRSYAFPNESGVFLLDAPSNGITYGRKDKAWVEVSGSASGGSGGSGLGVAVQENAVFLGTGTTLNFIGLTENILDASISGSIARVAVIPENGPQGFGYNYWIDDDLTSSGSVTVRLKTMASADPSPSNRLIFRIGDDRREVTSALSMTIPSGTNWCNLASSELVGRDTDLFVYVIWQTSGGGAVKLGISRIPYAKTMGDFTNTATSEKYIAGNWTVFTSTDQVEVIGRIRKHLRSSMVWFDTNPVTICRPIYKTDRLEYVPTWVGFTTQPGVVFNYIVDMSTVFVYAMASGDLTSNSADTSATLPFTCATITGFLPRNSTSAKNSGTLATTPGMATITSAATTIVYYRDFAATAWTSSGTKQVYATEIYYPLV